MTDARFQDGGEGPLRLIAQDAEDLKVISTLVQDAVLGGGDKLRRRAGDDRERRD